MDATPSPSPESLLGKRVKIKDFGIDGIIAGAWLKRGRLPEFSVEYRNDHGAITNRWFTLDRLEIID